MSLFLLIKAGVYLMSLLSFLFALCKVEFAEIGTELSCSSLIEKFQIDKLDPSRHVQWGEGGFDILRLRPTLELRWG